MTNYSNVACEKKLNGAHPKHVYFDLDHTLLAGDSDDLWGEFMVTKGVFDGAEYAAKRRYFSACYKRGALPIEEFLAFMLQPLARTAKSTLHTWRREFQELYLRPRISRAARALVEGHQQRGQSCILITATNQFLAEASADLLGLEKVLATQLEVLDGEYTGNMLGTPCFREGKLHHLRKHFEGHAETWKQARFYSDSINDLALLSAVSHPVAVNPDPALHQHAITQGWPVMTLG